MSALQAFMARIIDYAGLFPPAGLEIGPAVRNFAAYRKSPHADMLHRFIVPFTRLDEFEREAEALIAGTASAEAPWRLSVLVSDIDPTTLGIFNSLIERHENRVDIVSIEMKTTDPASVDHVLEMLPETITPYLEFPLDAEYRGFITALSGDEAAAKIRTGGLEPQHFPSPETVAEFIHRCVDNRVSFKATAGLHHPVYHRNEQIGVMEHGFFNVFGAAVMAAIHRLGVDDIRTILALEDAAAFRFEDDRLTILDWSVNADEINEARQLAHGYGSCSFNEPIEDLQGLKLL